MKNQVSNQNQVELCAALGMKYEEASELFGTETLQEMQMAQISGEVLLFSMAGPYSHTYQQGDNHDEFIIYGPGFIKAIYLDYNPTTGLTISGDFGFVTNVKSYVISWSPYGYYGDYIYTMEYEVYNDDPSCGHNDPSCGC